MLSHHCQAMFVCFETGSLSIGLAALGLLCRSGYPLSSMLGLKVCATMVLGFFFLRECFGMKIVYHIDPKTKSLNGVSWFSGLNSVANICKCMQQDGE